MGFVRGLATKISSTTPIRRVGSLYRQYLRSRRNPDDFERIAFSKSVGFFAVGERSALATLRNGLSVRVNTDDHVGRVLYAMGDFQPRISSVIRDLLDPGDTVIDIGANVGWFVATAAPLVGEHGRVIAFEPQPNIAAMLRETIAINRLSQVTLNEFALSNEDSQMTLHILSGNSGAARLAEPTSEGDWHAVSVPVKNALTVLSDLAIPHIRMVKIDVEGHEGAVLEACEPYLISHPADIVIFESNAHGEPPFFERTAVMALNRMGYRFFQLAKDKSKFVEVPPDGRDAEYENDFLAIHSGANFASDIARLGATARNVN